MLFFPLVSCPYFLSHDMKVMSKALVSLFRLSAIAAAASTFCFALVVSLSFPFREWWRCRRNADAFMCAFFALLVLIAPPQDSPRTSPSATFFLLFRLLLSSSLSVSLPAVPAERMRIPSESLTTTASAVVLNRTSYVRRVNARVSPDACEWKIKATR